MQNIKPLTILIADDDLEDLELIEHALLHAAPEATILKTSGGRELLDTLDGAGETKLPDLIILDYNMPELKGPEVISLLAQNPDYLVIPKLILSTSNSPKYEEESLKNGALGYYVKPANMQEFYKVAAKMISNIN